MRKLIMGGCAAGLLLFSFTTFTANAAPKTVKAVTHSSNHPDTTNCETGVSSSNGPVWAYDNLSRQLVVTANGGGSYTVVVTDHGSFSAFAEPNNADCATAHPISANGSITGVYTLSVTATQGPDPSALPAQMDGSVSTGATVQMLFGGNASSIVGGDYTYTYQSHGQTYVQNTSGQTGDITG